MNDRICYLNTDLDLVCADDLTEIAKAFDALGAPPLHVTKGDDGLWYTTFETNEQHEEPGPNISEMLAIIESFAVPLQSLWTRCSLREFNIGYDCGAEPWAFNQALSTELLRRMAAVGCTLRITLYPDRDGIALAESPQ
jgi:hypothetical protein